MAVKNESIEPRRLPSQARSRERVERILDAASQILIHEGYSAFKTNLIAKRAGVSIGSVYQFFPNRYAILNALADRYRIRIADALVAHMGSDAPERPWPEMVGTVIDIMAEQWRSDWSFHSVWLAIRTTPELQEQETVFRKQLIDSTLALLIERILPGVDRTRRDTIAEIILETSNQLLDHSMRKGEEQQGPIIDELKHLLIGYMRYLEEEGNPARA